MCIGELAKVVGVGVETVRYYQRIGPLSTPEKTLLVLIRKPTQRACTWDLPVGTRRCRAARGWPYSPSIPEYSRSCSMVCQTGGGDRLLFPAVMCRNSTPRE
jgi:hypothetical protein